MRAHDGCRLLVGGSPRRALRLTDDGARAARALLAGAPVSTAAEAALARRLVAAGIAHPVPPPIAVDVDVIVPVYNDVAGLLRCLDPLVSKHAVTVVDDGSDDPEPIARVAASRGADVVRLPVNRGPGAARNAGMSGSHRELVAFVDSDVVVAPTALQRLAAHFADPLVAAVAPRVRASFADRGRVLGALATYGSPLDLGGDPARVHPQGHVPYVPSTVLVVRRSAFEAVGGFDESLRLGEDVDLVWRLVAAGYDVRLDPSAVAHHAEPSTWSAWLRRRFRYGTSAAALAQRHPGAATLTIQPAPLATVALAATGQPRAAATVAAVTAGRLGRRLRRAGVPITGSVAASLFAPAQVGLATTRWLTQLGWPIATLALVRSHRRWRWLATLAAPPLAAWADRQPRLDPISWTVASWIDDAAYGAGVWAGSIRRRTAAALLPRLPRTRDTGDIRR